MADRLQSGQDRIFDFLNCFLLTIVLFSVLFPLYFILIASISSPEMVSAGNVVFLPRQIGFQGYERILKHTQLWTGYRNTIFYTIAGTAVNLVLTLTAGYALSRKDLVGKNIISAFLVFTMLFSGGLIPSYLLVKKLGMLNTIWAMIIPNAVSVWNIIIARTFFQTNIPDEMLEAAIIDGASNSKFFIKIVLPISPAIIAVQVLFYGVGHWNSFFNALIYLRDEKLYPLQLILREILVTTQIDSAMVEDARTIAEQHKIADTIKYAVIIVANIPVLILYPFLQKYFVKGIMIGAIKR